MLKTLLRLVFACHPSVVPQEIVKVAQGDVASLSDAGKCQLRVVKPSAHEAPYSREVADPSRSQMGHHVQRAAGCRQGKLTDEMRRGSPPRTRRRYNPCSWLLRQSATDSGTPPDANR